MDPVKKQSLLMRVYETVSHPPVVTLLMVLWYISMACIGVFTIIGVVDDPPRMVYNLPLDAYWILSSILLIFGAPLGAFGAWTGWWIAERPALLATAGGALISSSTNLAASFMLGSLHASPFIVIVTIITLASTRWLRISKDYSDPRKANQRVAEERKKYLNALNGR